MLIFMKTTSCVSVAILTLLLVVLSQVATVANAFALVSSVVSTAVQIRGRQSVSIVAAQQQQQETTDDEEDDTNDDDIKLDQEYVNFVKSLGTSECSTVE